MNIVVSRQTILNHISAKGQKYCLECRVYFEPASLIKDSHAAHYSWFLPNSPEDFELWTKRVQEKDESVWGYLMDEHGTRSVAFCPVEFTLEVKD